MTARKLRVFLVEDHATEREALRLLIDAEADMTVVGEAAHTETAIARGRSVEPDVVVMDVSSPRLNASSAAAAWKRQVPTCSVLSLSLRNDASHLRDLLRAGVSGYVLKQSSPSDFLRAIRTVAAGATFMDPAITAHVVEAHAGTLGELTTREIEIVRLAALGYSHKEIAARFGLSVKTIDGQKTASMRKLKLASRVDLVRFAREHGWLTGLE